MPCSNLTANKGYANYNELQGCACGTGGADRSCGVFEHGIEIYYMSVLQLQGVAGNPRWTKIRLADLSSSQCKRRWKKTLNSGVRLAMAIRQLVGSIRRSDLYFPFVNRLSSISREVCVSELSFSSTLAFDGL